MNEECGFLDGVIWAAQQIAIAADEPTLAIEYILKESNFSQDAMKASQKKSGFQTRKMNRLISEADDE